MEKVQAPPTSAGERLCIGTVQFGMRYGIANKSGKPDSITVQSLLQLCEQTGLLHFDTAEAYGESEQVLGHCFRTLGITDRVRVTSKASLVTPRPELLRQKVEQSLQRLGVPSLEAWLLHEEKQLDHWNDALSHESAALLQRGVVRHFGLSCYSPSYALRALREHKMSALQFPLNPFDRRFLNTELLSTIQQTNAVVFVRSIYLQGLCLMAPELVPARISHAGNAVATLARFCQKNGLERDLFCLHYALHRTASVRARLVIGLDNEDQLRRTCLLASSPAPDAALFDEWDKLWPENLEDLILPYRWPPDQAR